MKKMKKKILIFCIALIVLCINMSCLSVSGQEVPINNDEVTITTQNQEISENSLTTKVEPIDSNKTTAQKILVSEITATEIKGFIDESTTKEKSGEIITKEVATTKASAINYPLTYADNTCSITIERKWYEDAWCYIAKLSFSDYDRFGTAPANGTHLNGFETTSSFANRYGAIFAVNGDYACPDTGNTAIRSGIVYTDKNCKVPAVYNAHTGIFDSPSNLGIFGELFSTLVAEKKVTDSFTFWSWSIVKNGEVVHFDDTSRAQRTFIGSNGNSGEIIVVVSEGRYADGESAGLTLNQCGKLMKELGCVTAVPLDGGGSSTMYFKGKVINSAKGQERAVRDFVYFK